VNPLISEFSYGYALTEELAAGNRGALRGAPVFPSLIDEGNRGGYDVQLPFVGSPLFLQFKLSHYLRRSSAKEWPHWGAPYYRMYLRPLRHSRQHNLLLGLESQGNEVYYATAMFHTAAELNAAYAGRQVVQSSAFFRPHDIGPLPDAEQHYVVFHPQQSTAYLHSNEGHPIEMVKGTIWQEKILFAADQRVDDLTETFFRELLDRIRKAMAEELPTWERREEVLSEQFTGRERAGLAAYISYLVRTYFDAQFFLVTSSDEHGRSRRRPEPSG